MTILVTGGAGYIGSHTCVELMKNGHFVVIVDNLVNSSWEVNKKISEITGKSHYFYKDDVRDEKALEEVFEDMIEEGKKIDAVIHFAGLKAVGESVDFPTKYYDNNLNSTITLLKVMKKFNVTKIIFSSSATVYSAENHMPLKEDGKLGAVNPYGWSKLMCEKILEDAAVAEEDWSVVLLRYFNPVGAHESGLIGENPKGLPNNLVPFISQTAKGMYKEVKIFGDDYDTKDGTGIRDYIHVVDLAKGHVKAIDYAFKNIGCKVFNLGTGNGVSVLEMINTFISVNEVDIPYSVTPRRAGDNAVSYADPSKAFEVLGFTAEKTLADMCRDTWRFQMSTSLQTEN